MDTIEAIDRSILMPFRDMKWRIGSCHLRIYNRTETSVYGTNFLHYLYHQTVESGPHVLPSAFCGMQDISPDAICSYLHTRSPLILMCMDGESESDPFQVVGYAFPTVAFGTKSTERSSILGYCFFRSVWGTPEASVLGMLSTAYLFLEFDLVALHGQSYPWNHLTRKFVAQYGTKEVGTLPRSLLTPEGKLVDCIMSTLLREDFEDYAIEQLNSLTAESEKDADQAVAYYRSLMDR